MGKGTDKLYITHSEWSSGDAFGASHGAGAKPTADGASFKRLPFNFCALSLQPFSNPVCTRTGTIFDISNILPWLEKHGTNPVDGTPLTAGELIKLNFQKNDEGDYVDPVTFKVLTDNTHVIAIGKSGNVFAADTVERLNIKPKMWRDLVSDEEFGRKDLITIQDPQNISSRDLSSFKYLKDGADTKTEDQKQEQAHLSRKVNASALGNAARILKAKEAVAQARTDRAASSNPNLSASNSASKALSRSDQATPRSSKSAQSARPYNATNTTTGKAAASFTSTGLTPHTSADRALLTEEEYMLKPKRVKQPGYVRLSTNFGDLSLELYPEYAPQAVRNFIELAKQGYYNGVGFHRNVRSFMIQGGDPTGTGKGGQSIWGKNFPDELDGPLKHDARGVLSMANKGRDTNSSQFFILYRPARHLDRKHTVFGRVVEGLDVIDQLEAVEVDDGKRPLKPIKIEEATILVDPFEDFLKSRSEKEEMQRAKEAEGLAEEDMTTWSGKRVRGEREDAAGGSDSVGIGRYLKAAASSRAPPAADEEIIEEWEEVEEPAKKKAKASSGFGNFDSW